MLDGGMAVGFLLLMADRFTGNLVHEWLGLLLCVLIFLHVRINRRWWGFIPERFRKDTVRTLVNLAVVLFFVGAVLSAVPVSETLFSFLGIRGSLVARGVHMFFAHWCFLLAAVHLGLYSGRVAASLRQKLPVPAVVSAGKWKWAACLPAVYGLYAFDFREIVLPLTMTGSFTAWNSGDSMAWLLLDYLSVFYLVVWLCTVLRMRRTA